MGFGCILVHITLRFGAKWSAFWCILQCVLVHIAVRFAAKCVATTSDLTSFSCCCGCKFGRVFLQREMQKHSKWPRTEGTSTQKLPKFHHLGAFYMAFSGYFFLEWFGRRTWFVKHNYRFNKLSIGTFRDKNTGAVLAQAIRLSMMGTMMWTMLTPIGHCRLCGFSVLSGVLSVL